MKNVLLPEGWPRPRGYANGVSAQGRQVFVAGMVGWNAAAEFESDDLVDQVRQALRNVAAVLAEAGARPEHMVRMTWYVVDRADYLARGRDIGLVYREVMGPHYDVAMSAVEVSALMEARAKVEIEVTAVVPQAL
ncbi:MAG TPA: RidA family protein [Burkholderiaceae bacterium]|jgi:enamine deaminase RidA (YjgF/YER057c/UK114 family)|nr:RidA family protein [Burkholderiaceae bacterium]